MMNRTAAYIREFHEIAREFCQSNPHTYFLLERIKAHDKYIYEHSIRSAYISLLLANGLDYSFEEQEILYRTALLRDIGMLQVKENHEKYAKGTTIIQSSDNLHPVYSVQVLDLMISEGLVDKEAILLHHENLDGTGYPYGLVWEDISLNARILRAADSFVSMTFVDHRNGSLSGVDQALDELYRWSDIHYDADLAMMLLYYYDTDIKRTEQLTKAPNIRLINN